MIDPYRLSLSVTQADGKVVRWGPDEPDGRDIPQGLEFGTSIPGGYQDISCSLFREIRKTNADNVLFDSVRCYGPGNETAWEGYFSQFPREHGDQFSVQPGGVGWIAALGFETGFREIYRNFDLTGWGAPSVTRQLNLLAAGTSFRIIDSGTVGWDNSGDLSLVLRVDRMDNGASTRDMADAWYRSGGIPLGSLYYDVITRTPTGAVFGSDTWGVKAGLANDDLAVDDQTATLRAGGTGTLTAGGTDRTFANVQAYYDATNTEDGPYQIFWRALALYGTHGLTLRGTEPDAGFYSSDVLADALARTAPMLTFSTGAGGSIEDAHYVIPHLVFDSATGRDVVERVSAFGTDSLVVPEWGVYDNREFFWRTPDPDRLCWQARVADGAKLKLEGEQADDLFNGVIVTYQDASGTARTVGPPAAYWYNGTAIADATDSSLVDTTATNPVNAHGIPRKWAKLELSQPATSAFAIRVGAVFLAEKSQPQRRGEISLVGTVGHPTIDQPQPTWKPRAGDYIQVTDGNPDDREIRRRIVQTRYHHDSRELVATLDNSAFRLDALLEQLQAGLVGKIT